MISATGVPPFREGQQVKDRYYVQRVLGGEAEALVFKAHDMMFKRDVVLRIAKHNDQEARKIFKRSAEKMAKLADPGVAQVYDIFEIVDNTSGENRLCLVAEYIEGITLEKWLKENPTASYSTRRMLFEMIGQTVQVCHEEDITHGDLHARNIMIRTRDSKPVLIDFGSSGEYPFGHPALKKYDIEALIKLFLMLLPQDGSTFQRGYKMSFVTARQVIDYLKKLDGVRAARHGGSGNVCPACGNFVIGGHCGCPW